MIGLIAALGFAALARAEAPKLLVVVVVDQLRAETLDRLGPELRGGFKRLSKEGFAFTQARHTHAPLETGPGHAVIMTGRLPSEHGIVGNEWWDESRRSVRSSVDDPLWGRGPAQLAQYSLGDALKAKDSASVVVCLSGKDRAAILMCGKRADAAVWYDKDEGRLATSGYYGALPAWAKTPPLSPATTSYYDDFRYSAAVDRMTVNAAERAIEELRLGRWAGTDLVAIGLSGTDYIGHRHGPDGANLREQVLAVDALLERLLAALDRLGVPYTLALTSDHGIGRSTEGGGRLVPRPELRAAVESALSTRFPLEPGEGPWVGTVQTCSLALDRRLAASKGVPFGPLQAAALEAVRDAPGVSAAYALDELGEAAAAGKPFAEVLARSAYPGRSGHIQFVLEEGAQLDYRDGNAAFHGQPYELDARVPLLFFGAGVPAGRSDRPVAMTSFAATAARLAGARFPAGEALRELFPAPSP